MRLRRISFPLKRRLKTDRAYAFDKEKSSDAHHEATAIDPYTSALTMKSGWCWKIPMREEDHMGYVFSSQFLQRN